MLLQQARGTCATLKYFAEYHVWANRVLMSAILQRPLPTNAASFSNIANPPAAPALDPIIIAGTQCSCLFFSTIKATTSHIAIVDDLWLHRIIGKPKYEYNNIYSDDFAAAQWDGIHASFSEALDSLLQNDMALLAHVTALEAELATKDEEKGTSRAEQLLSHSGIQYLDTKGVTTKKQEAACLLHVFNHATHHRGQIHAALSHLHASSVAPPPPPLDAPVMGTFIAC
jgi:uncharacterized damage-inducible protein DinB